MPNVNGTGHTGPSEFCATSILAVLRRSSEVITLFFRTVNGTGQFRGKVGSDGFEKVLIGTLGARETFLQGGKDERRRTAF